MYPPRYMHISAFGKNAGHMHAGRVSEALVPAVLRLPSHQLHEVGCPHAHAQNQEHACLGLTAAGAERHVSPIMSPTCHPHIHSSQRTTLALESEFFFPVICVTSPPGRQTAIAKLIPLNCTPDVPH